jgi:hypothetical protein
MSKIYKKKVQLHMNHVLLPLKNDTKIFHHYKFLLFSLGGGYLKILTEARSKIVEKFWQKFERLFEDKKLYIHKKYINKDMETKIAHLLVKKSSFISANSLVLFDKSRFFFCFLEM